MNQSDFPPNWPSPLGGDRSTQKQKDSRRLNWAKFMVDGMEAQLKYLLNEGAIDPYAHRQAVFSLNDVRISIAFQEKMKEIESEYRKRFGVL
jgi:hypothetical protein